MATRKYWTLGQIKAKIKRETDIEDEDFIRPEELEDYINEAIDEAEAEIHSLYEDYFLTREGLSLVANEEEYALPANIYAHKIRRVTYNNTSSVYTVKRSQDWKKFEKYEIAQNFQTSDLYQYFIVNETAAEPRIIIFPQARETGSFVRIWYIRQANRLEDDTDICDIPEFIQFVFSYVKYKIYAKEGNPMVAQAGAALEHQRKLMAGTLATMVPDAENNIEMDMTHYEEMN